MRLRGESPSYFDIPYGIPSSKLSVGFTVINSTAADYFGFAVVVSSAPVTLTIFNGTSTTAAVMDVITVTTSTRIMNTMPVRARIALGANVTGTNGSATVFYTPKG